MGNELIVLILIIFIAIGIATTLIGIGVFFYWLYGIGEAIKKNSRGRDKA